MGAKIKLAIIGFPPEITEEIAVMVEQISLGIVVTYHESVNSQADFKLNLIGDVDIIFLNSVGYKTPAPEVITLIKVGHPLVQVVVVSFIQNYTWAVNCFRAGARDILDYPINRTDFTVSLQRAATYRSFYKRSESMIEVLNVVNNFSDWRRFETEEKLYQAVDEFLMKKLRASPLIVLSVASASSTLKINEENFEVIFNKGSFSKSYQKEDLEKVFESFRPREIERNFYPYAHYVVEGTSYFFIGLGHFHQKRHLALFKIQDFDPENLPMDFIGHFSRLIKNATDHLYKSKRHDELVSLTYTDDVTGLFNQRKLFVDLDENIRRYEKDKEPFCVLFIDVDHFKQVNDGHGHLTGSLLLVQLALEFKKVLRETDYIYRYGGDEFVVIVPNAGVTLGKEIGERILATVAKRKFETSGKKQFQLGLSIGVASYPEHASSREDILKLADEMMYEAKKTGRGRVCLAHEALGKRKAN